MDDDEDNDKLMQLLNDADETDRDSYTVPREILQFRK